MDKKQDILDNKEVRENPFRVPDGYFSELPDRLKEKRTKRRPGFFTLVAPYAALAAGFLGIAAVGKAVLGHFSRDAGETESSLVCKTLDISDEDIINYLVYNDISITELDTKDNGQED